MACQLNRRNCLVWTIAALTLEVEASDSVSLEQARDALQDPKGMRVIDVREPEEHAAGVAAGAQLLPLSQLEQRRAEWPQDKNAPLLLICRTQNRSRAAALKLREAGYSRVQFVEGGMSEWQRRGWPMKRP